MKNADISRLAFLLLSILAAILVADRITAIILTILGIAGSAGFLAGFVLYAGFFFGILAIIERFTGFCILGLFQKE